MMLLYNKIIAIYKNISIRQKLLLLFSIQIIIPILFMGIMLYRNTENIVMRKSVTYAMDIIKMIELRLNDFDKELKASSQDLLYDDLLYDVLKEEGTDLFTYYQKVDQFRSKLRRINLSKEIIQSILVYDSRGRYISYNANSSSAIIEELLSYKELQAATRKVGGIPLWYFVKNDLGEVSHIYLVRAIYDIADYNEIGMMAILIKKNQLENIYSGLSTEFMESIMFFSEDKDVISAINPIDNKLLNSTVFADNKQTMSSYQNSKKNTILTKTMVEGNKWTVVTEVSLEQLNSDLENFKVIMILLTIITLLILSIFTILMAMDIIEPINRLVRSIKKMKDNNEYETVLIDRKDELGYLSECFNNMSVEIDILLNQVYREQLTRKNAELKALQAQINPHFLFNTLESINWLAQLKEAPEISDMVTALSSLMEASIGKGNSLIPMKDEIIHAESYILIMKNRYGERLTFESRIDEKLLKVKIPKLTLQPIIENAIYHGIDKVRKGGSIQLTIAQQQGDCLVIIEDNGKGMTNTQAAEINKEFHNYNDDYLTNESSRGIGLINVNHRIKLYCGERFGLKIKSWLNHGTKVVIRLPIKK